jgi:hypothetical protein
VDGGDVGGGDVGGGEVGGGAVGGADVAVAAGGIGVSVIVDSGWGDDGIGVLVAAGDVTVICVSSCGAIAVSVAATPVAT